MILAYLSVGVLLVVHFALMLTVDTDMGYRKCDFIATLYTFGIVTVQGLVLRFLLGEGDWGRLSSVFWLYLGSYLFYRSVFLTEKPDDDRDYFRYFFYKVVVGGGVALLAITVDRVLG